MPKCSKSYYYRCIWCFRGLEFDKNVPRLVTTGAINLKKKQSEGNTLLRYEYLFYPNTQFQMLKSFNSLLIQKFTVSAGGTSCLNFFSAHCTCVNFFWDDGLVQEFFSYVFPCRIVFFQNQPPLLAEVKWLAPYIVFINRFIFCPNMESIMWIIKVR